MGCKSIKQKHSRRASRRITPEKSSTHLNEKTDAHFKAISKTLLKCFGATNMIFQFLSSI